MPKMPKSRVCYNDGTNNHRGLNETKIWILYTVKCSIRTIHGIYKTKELAKYVKKDIEKFLPDYRIDIEQEEIIEEV